MPYYRDMLLRGDKRMALANLMHRLSVGRDVRTGMWILLIQNAHEKGELLALTIMGN
jgi:hypothetical protein